MAEGGSSTGATGGAGAGATATGAVAAAPSEGEVSTKEAAKAEGEKKTGDKAGAVVDNKTVTVEEVKDKSTIDKDHLEGEKKEKPKHKYAERLAKAFPERQYASDDDYDKALDEHLTNLEGYKERGTRANEQLIQLFEAEPWVADLVRSMINGEPGIAALAKHFSPDDFNLQPGDIGYEVLEKNKKERSEKLAKIAQFNKEFNENVEVSTKTIEEFAKENNLTIEASEKFFDDFDNMLADIYRGKITKETLVKIMRAVKHDEAVQAAKEEGEIKGRNEKIMAEKEKESGVKEKTDGIPVLGKTGEETKEETVKPKSKIDQILEAQKKRSNF